MVCIIFTRTKLLAGAKLKSTELLSIDGKHSVSYGNRSMAETLSSSLKSILSAYEAYLKKNQIQLPKAIPTAIAFPPELSLDPTGKTKKEAALQVLAKSSPNKFEIVHTDELGLSFLQGIKADKKTIAGPCLILDALDDHVNLYYQKGGNDLINGNGKVVDFVPVKDLGARWGDENLVKELVDEFKNAGLLVNEKDKTELATQVKKNLKDHKYTLQRTSGTVRIQAEVSIPDNRYKDVVSANRVKLKERLNTATLDSKGIQKVVLMGEYLNNEVIRNYLNTDLRLASRILTTKHNGQFSEYRAIIEGLMDRTNIAIEARAEVERKRREEDDRRKKEEELKRKEAERKRREEEERRKKEEEERRKKEEEKRRIEAERTAQIARNKMLDEIRITCKTTEKIKEYEMRFVPKGIKLGMPREVILWNINEAIKSSTLIPEAQPLALSTPTPPIPTPKPTPSPAPKSEPVVSAALEKKKEIEKPKVTPKPVEKEEVLKKEKLMSLNELFEVKGVLLDVEFATKKVLSIGDKITKVIKLLPTEEIKVAEKFDAFQKLYQKELKYYGELSEIETAAEGKYYAREYIERNTLKDYLKRSGISKKDSFSELTSNDLKFILQVFKEVENLDVSHADLNENNILVIAKRRWNLQKEVEIKFVGFTSKDCPKAEMTQQLHAIWTKLLGENIYKEFREKLDI